VCNPDGKRDLLKATYTRIGNISGVRPHSQTRNVSFPSHTVLFPSHIALFHTASHMHIPTHMQPLPETTTQEALNEAHKLKKDFETTDIHKAMVVFDNFEQASVARETGKPERGHGSVLPRHRPEHGMRWGPLVVSVVLVWVHIISSPSSTVHDPILERE